MERLGRASRLCCADESAATAGEPCVEEIFFLQGDKSNNIDDNENALTDTDTDDDEDLETHSSHMNNDYASVKDNNDPDNKNDGKDKSSSKIIMPTHRNQVKKRKAQVMGIIQMLVII